MKAGENKYRFDPEYVQISRKEAADILGIGMTRFDELRLNDPDCPKGFKTGEARSCPVLFRLADIYRYSDILMQRYSCNDENIEAIQA